MTPVRRPHDMNTVARILVLIIAGLSLLGCAATRTTSFLHPEFDFSSVERVAVVPFEDLTREQGTGSYVTRVFLTELLATGAFDVVEPGEVTRVVGSLGPTRPAELNYDQIKKAGQQLNVQTVIFGTVGESVELRSSSSSAHAVSLDVRMVEVETGATIWSAVVNTGGPGFFARLFGTGEQTRGAAVRKAVRKSIGTLVR